MALWSIFRRTVESKPLEILTGDLDSLFVRTKVDGACGIASVGDLLRCYQKNRHADNRMREAADTWKRAKESDAPMRLVK
jgi:hypothetical protein